MRQEKDLQTLGASVGDERITYEIGRNKPENLADQLNGMDASGCELTVVEGYGGGSVYLMAVVRRKQR